MFSLAGGEVDYDTEASFSAVDKVDLARGLIEPLLGIPAVASTERKEAA